MILVTGATGTVGGAVLARLSRLGVPVRALVRSPERADDLRGYDCQIAIGEFGDEPSLRRALRDVTAVFLVSPVSPRQVGWESSVIDVAAATSRPRLVKLAAFGYEQLPGLIGDNHRTVVDRLRQAGLDHTVLAPNAFFQNLLTAAASISHGVWSSRAGAGAVSMVDAGDVAAVAAQLLTAPEHTGLTYRLTGPQPLTGPDVAATLSTVLGRPVRHLDPGEPGARAQLAARGAPDWLADALLAVWAQQAAGAAAAVTDEVERVTGRPARPLADFLAGHRSAFAAA